MKNNVFKKEEWEELRVADIYRPFDLDEYFAGYLGWSKAMVIVPQQFRGKYIERYFMHYNTRNHYGWWEIGRRFEGSTVVYLKGYIKLTLQGYHIDWTWIKDDNFYSCWWNFNAGIRFRELEDNLIKRDETLKYSGFEYQDTVHLLEWVSIYRQYPNIERLAKMGYGWLAPCYNMLNLSNEANTIYKMTGLSREWVDYINKYYLCTYTRVKAFDKRGYKPEQAERYLIIEKDLPAKSFAKMKLSPNQFEHYCEWLEKLSYYEKMDYKDYLKMCVEYNINLTDPYWYKPNSVRDRHAYLLGIKDERRKYPFKKYEKDFEKVVGKHPIHLEKKNLKIDIADSIQTIINNGDAMCICVGRSEMAYVKKMSEDKTLILFAYIDDALEACIEYDWKQKEILQCRGKGNCLSKYDDKIRGLLNGFKNNTIQKLSLA